MKKDSLDNRLWFRIGRNLGYLEDTAVAALLGLICVVMALGVFNRFVLKIPLAWADELATFSFVWLALLGATIGVRDKAHIGVDAVTRLYSPSFRRLVALVILVMIEIFLIVLTKLGIDLCIQIGDQRSPALQIQMFWVYLSLPVSAGLMVLHIAAALYEEAKGIVSGT